MDKNFADKTYEKIKYLADLKADISRNNAIHEYCFDFLDKYAKQKGNDRHVKISEMGRSLSQEMLNDENEEILRKIQQGEKELEEMLKND